MSGRKIIQIAAMPLSETGAAAYAPTVIALASDGTMWESNYSHSDGGWGQWQQLPELPAAGAGVDAE